MTLSSHKQNRVSSLDAALKMIEQRGRKRIRLVILGVALVVAGLGAPDGTLADWNTLEPDQTASERSIALIEGSNPENVVVVTAGDAEFHPLSVNERSIALIESKEAPGGMLAGGVPDVLRAADR